jgi:hypothetical protein
MSRTIKYSLKWLSVLTGLTITGFLNYQCSSGKKTTVDEPIQTIQTNVDSKGIAISLRFIKGSAHNHPLMAVWLEDTSGRYIETLYVAESIGKGVFQHGDKSTGQWQAGPIRRPAALPYWGHKRGIQAPDGLYIPIPDDPMPDAVTGPTPGGNFSLESNSTGTLPSVFRVLMEINQSWDWNEYWTNDKFPQDNQYKTSSQPAVIYEARVDLDSGQQEFLMKAIGHSHYSGQDGDLYTDLSTLSTALEIVGSAKVMVTAGE